MSRENSFAVLYAGADAGVRQNLGRHRIPYAAENRRF